MSEQSRSFIQGNQRSLETVRRNDDNFYAAILRSIEDHPRIIRHSELPGIITALSRVGNYSELDQKMVIAINADGEQVEGVEPFSGVLTGLGDFRSNEGANWDQLQFVNNIVVNIENNINNYSRDQYNEKEIEEIWKRYQIKIDALLKKRNIDSSEAERSELLSEIKGELFSLDKELSQLTSKSSLGLGNVALQ
jgi:hypothetical protein